MATKKHKRTVRRNATRNRPALTVVPDLPSGERPEPLDALLGEDRDDLADVGKPVLDSLMRELAGVRAPLGAELLVCEVFRLMERHAPEDAGEPERLVARTALLGELIGHAQTAGTDDALALLRVLATLGPDETRAAGGE